MLTQILKEQLFLNSFRHLWLKPETLRVNALNF